MVKREIIPANQSSAGHIECSACDMYPLCRPFRINNIDYDLVRQVVRRRIPVKRGTTLFLRGDQAPSFYAICAGSFKEIISNKDKEAEPRIIGFVLPGELSGLDSYASGIRHFNLQALEPSAVCELCFESLANLKTGVPGVQQSLISMLTDEVVRNQNFQLMFMGRQRASERLATFLINLAHRYSTTNGVLATQFKLTMNRSDIGDYLSLATETVSRVFVQFQENGWITIAGKQVSINQREALLELSAP